MTAKLEITTAKNEQDTTSKKPYEAPVLQNYGEVQTATLAIPGTGGDDGGTGVTGDSFYLS